MSTKPHFSLLATSFAGGPRPRNAALILAGLWLAIFFAALFAPPILDDADATHAQAARAMATTGDLVTLRVDGVRYLEKAPLPYWLAALSFRIFGFNTFAAHLPQTLAVALLVLLGHRWANQAFGSRTAFYTAIALLTSLGPFLFTRILIPEALLSLLLAAALFAFLKSLGPISSELEPPVIQGVARSQQTPAGLVPGEIFASPQIGSTSLEEALRESGGPGIERFIQIAREIEANHHIAMRHRLATGVWESGAEPSVMSSADAGIDSNTLNVVAAIRGLVANQRAVLTWYNDVNGPHVRYVVDLKGVDGRQAAYRLVASGIEHGTVEETHDGVQIHIFQLAPGRQATTELQSKLYEHFREGDIHEGTGYGQLIWQQAPTPDQSQWTYNHVIESYARRSGHPSAGRGTGRDDNPEDRQEVANNAPSHRASETRERPALIPSAAPLYPYLMWASLALAVLTKGLVALVFFATTSLLYLILLGEFKASLPKLKPLTGALLFLAIAAPWHILAALRNPGWVRFYFWNEHVLRFLGRRTPPDFNRLPGYLYWTLHLVWLFPWSLFLPLGFAAVRRRSNHQTKVLTASLERPSETAYLVFIALISLLLTAVGDVFWHSDAPYVMMYIPLTLLYLGAEIGIRRHRASLTPSPFHRIDPQQRTILVLSLFAAIVLLFFSLSTNQEYYTFPVYLPLLLLVSATITRAEQTYSTSPDSRRWITVAHAAFTLIGAAVALTLLYGLIASRHIPYTQDIGTLLLRRNVAANTLSLSHLFDLTTDAFAALRLPAALAATALLLGPALAWLLRTQRRHIAATTAIAFTSGLFLIAAHLAFARFAPMLSSQSFAAQIQRLESTHNLPPNTPVLIFGDQAYGSSLPFYLNRPASELVQLVDGRTTSLQFGSTFPDAPPIFLTPAQLAATWSQPPTKLLFIPAERREEALHLLPPNPIILRSESGKLLLTNHPLK